MKGRDFLVVARELLRGGTAAHWRSASGRAYYGLLLEARESLQRWGFALPPRDKVHMFVKLRFVYSADPGMHDVGIVLDQLSQLRNRADYDLNDLQFRTDVAAAKAVSRVADSIDELDAADSERTRRAQIIADIRSRWP